VPELPELEVMRDVLDRRIIGRHIAQVRPCHPGILKTVEPPVDLLVGRAFAHASRRGKHLVLTCDEHLHVVVHLMLAGRLVQSESNRKITKATGFVLAFEDGKDLRIVENGTKRRVKLYVVRDPSHVDSIATLGVDPLSEAFTLMFLEEMFGGLRRQLKKVLTDQRTIAGIGSAYADEILHAAKLSPIRYASTMKPDEIERLHRATQAVLTHAIDAIRKQAGEALVGGHSREFLQVYKRTGQPCPRCATPIAEIRYAQTKTYYCPHCQSSDRAIADRRSWLTR